MGDEKNGGDGTLGAVLKAKIPDVEKKLNGIVAVVEKANGLKKEVELPEKLDIDVDGIADLFFGKEVIARYCEKVKRVKALEIIEREAEIFADALANQKSFSETQYAQEILALLAEQKTIPKVLRSIVMANKDNVQIPTSLVGINGNAKADDDKGSGKTIVDNNKGKTAKDMGVDDLIPESKDATSADSEKNKKKTIEKKGDWPTYKEFSEKFGKFGDRRPEFYNKDGEVILIEYYDEEKGKVRVSIVQNSKLEKDKDGIINFSVGKTDYGKTETKHFNYKEFEDFIKDCVNFGFVTRGGEEVRYKKIAKKEPVKKTKKVGPKEKVITNSDNVGKLDVGKVDQEDFKNLTLEEFEERYEYGKRYFRETSKERIIVKLIKYFPSTGIVVLEEEGKNKVDRREECKNFIKLYKLAGEDIKSGEIAGEQEPLSFGEEEPLVDSLKESQPVVDLSDVSVKVVNDSEKNVSQEDFKKPTLEDFQKKHPYPYNEKYIADGSKIIVGLAEYLPGTGIVLLKEEGGEVTRKVSYEDFVNVYDLVEDDGAEGAVINPKEDLSKKKIVDPSEDLSDVDNLDQSLRDPDFLKSALEKEGGIVNYIKKVPIVGKMLIAYNQFWINSYEKKATEFKNEMDRWEEKRKPFKEERDKIANLIEVLKGQGITKIDSLQIKINKLDRKDARLLSKKDEAQTNFENQDNLIALYTNKRDGVADGLIEKYNKKLAPIEADLKNLISYRDEVASLIVKEEENKKKHQTNIDALEKAKNELGTKNHLVDFLKRQIKKDPLFEEVNKKIKESQAEIDESTKAIARGLTIKLSINNNISEMDIKANPYRDKRDDFIRIKNGRPLRIKIEKRKREIDSTTGEDAKLNIRTDDNSLVETSDKEEQMFDVDLLIKDYNRFMEREYGRSSDLVVNRRDFLKKSGIRKNDKIGSGDFKKALIKYRDEKRATSSPKQ